MSDTPLLLGDRHLAASGSDGLAWESEPLGSGAQWLGRPDDEVHLRRGDLLHRVAVRHGRATREPAPW